jgi:respiratory burst oxidase
VLLLGLGIGATPMIPIIKDIINNMKRQDGDLESGASNDASVRPSFRTRRAYFDWVMPEQGDFEWFHGVMDEVAKTEDLKGVIEINNYCTRAKLKLQSLNHAKHDLDLVRRHFRRPNWRDVYNSVALNHHDQRVGKNPSYAYCTASLIFKGRLTQD